MWGGDYISHLVVWNVVNEVDPCAKKQGTDYKVQKRVDTQDYQPRDKRVKKGDKWTLVFGDIILCFDQNNKTISAAYIEKEVKFVISTCLGLFLQTL